MPRVDLDGNKTRGSPSPTAPPNRCSVFDVLIRIGTFPGQAACLNEHFSCGGDGWWSGARSPRSSSQGVASRLKGVYLGS